MEHNLSYNIEQIKAGVVLICVQYPKGQEIADSLFARGISVLFSGAHPAHLPGVANIIKNSSNLITDVICDQSNAHFFDGLHVNLIINNFDVAVAA